ncbi:hypothetical protein NHX12_017268, partial [Muraenolepis orangiensis]
PRRLRSASPAPARASVRGLEFGGEPLETRVAECVYSRSPDSSSVSPPPPGQRTPPQGPSAAASMTSLPPVASPGVNSPISSMGSPFSVISSSLGSPCLPGTPSVGYGPISSPQLLFSFPSPVNEEMPVEKILEAEMAVEQKTELHADGTSGGSSPNDPVTNICQAADKQLFTLVEWAKRIPHFSELSMDDQVILLRADPSGQQAWSGLEENAKCEYIPCDAVHVSPSSAASAQDAVSLELVSCGPLLGG